MSKRNMAQAARNAAIAVGVLEAADGTVHRIKVRWIVDVIGDVEYADWTVYGTHKGERIEIDPTHAAPDHFVVEWGDIEHEVESLPELERLLSGENTLD
jgi:hypothetical protein